MSDSPETESHAGTSGAAAEVGRWLRVRGFGQYASLFGERGITMEDLPRLTEADLKELGIVKIVERANLLSAIAKLREPGSGTPQPDPVAPMAVAAASLPGMAKPIAIQPQFGGPVTPKFAPNATAATATGTATQAAVPARRRTMKERFGGRFLVISILVHLLFAVAATYYVVQTITAKRKLTFHGGPPSPNPSQRAIEHKVQMAKKQHSMSAPVPSKRVVSTGMSKVALPEMPSMPAMNPVASSKMVGMGGTGVGLSTGIMGAGNSGGGGVVPFFGFRSSGGGGLKGSFYDLKQTPGRRPTSIKDIKTYVEELDRFLKAGWDENKLKSYFKAPIDLNATQIFVPFLKSINAPKAFGVEKEVQPALWMALYKAQISPPASGAYHFVGGGDNILIVRLNGKIVLDRSWNYQEKFGIDRSWKPVANYDYGFGKIPKGFAKGPALQLTDSEYYDVEILLGDDGGVTHFSLLFEQEGVQYQKTSRGLPILPVFRTSGDPPPPGEHPPYMPNGPVWKARSAPTPFFSH